MADVCDDCGDEGGELFLGVPGTDHDLLCASCLIRVEPDEASRVGLVVEPASGGPSVPPGFCFACTNSVVSSVCLCGEDCGHPDCAYAQPAKWTPCEEARAWCPGCPEHEECDPAYAASIRAALGVHAPEGACWADKRMLVSHPAPGVTLHRRSPVHHAGCEHPHDDCYCGVYWNDDEIKTPCPSGPSCTGWDENRWEETSRG